MKQWNRHRIIILMLALAPVLALTFLGYNVLAQTTEPAPGERNEGRDGRTGQRLNMTPAQAQAILLDESNAIYHFAGALNDTISANQKATVVQCSNVHATEATELEVQLFQYNATNVYTGTIHVDPLETATFESSQVSFYSADVLMGAGFVEQGYGRILSEHDDVICTAQTVDSSNNPPTWSFDLPLYVDPLDAIFLPAVQNNDSP